MSLVCTAHPLASYAARSWVAIVFRQRLVDVDASRLSVLDLLLVVEYCSYKDLVPHSLTVCTGLCRVRSQFTACRARVQVCSALESLWPVAPVRILGFLRGSGTVVRTVGELCVLVTPARRLNYFVEPHEGSSPPSQLPSSWLLLIVMRLDVEGRWCPCAHWAC